ncbi:MAG: hypothetical protein IJ471_05705 [Eubacterium sp.]|nr:hypothetical protein [Eubacterium sp.]
MAKKRKKVVRYRKPFHINLGVLFFAIVFIYFAVYLISYLSEEHISVYEVQKGQIAENDVYTGLVLREESVIYADSSGVVNYYIKEGDKAKNGNLICSIDETGTISSQITQAGLDGTQLDETSLNTIESSISSYTDTNSDMMFYHVYAFKDDIDALVQEALYLNALDSLKEETQHAQAANTFSFEYAETDGVVAFYTDGYEEITVDTFTDEMYDPSSYQKNNLKINQSVSSGQALYKLVTNENWHIMVPIDRETANELQEETYITVTFRKDNTRVTPACEVKAYGTQNYLMLTFNSSMVRFISDRYVELELATDTTVGLKIPNSAIIEKEFLVIPKKYFSQGNDSSSQGVLKISSDKKGFVGAEFISTELYYETEDAYYIDEEDLTLGDVIQMPDSAEQYTITRTANLQGVYNINKGFAVFKQIDVIASNEEYSILKTGTSYGLSLYDHIALNGNEIVEGETIN